MTMRKTRLNSTRQRTHLLLLRIRIRFSKKVKSNPGYFSRVCSGFSRMTDPYPGKIRPDPKLCFKEAYTRCNLEITEFLLADHKVLLLSLSYCMSNKLCVIIYSILLNKTGQNLFDREYRKMFVRIDMEQERGAKKGASHRVVLYIYYIYIHMYIYTVFIYEHSIVR